MDLSWNRKCVVMVTVIMSATRRDNASHTSSCKYEKIINGIFYMDTDDEHLSSTYNSTNRAYHKMTN